MFEWDWDGAIVDDPSVEDLNSEFGKTMVGITYMRCSKIVYDGPSKAQGNDFENAVAVSMLCSKIEELSPGLVAECIGLGLADLTKRGIVLEKALMTYCSSQMGQYDRMERAMFDYIDCISDEFFHSVTVNEMDAAMEFFTQITHDKIHTAYATAMGRMYRAMDKNH